MYAEMNGPEMLEACGQDAMKWAEAFVELNPGTVGADVMVGWFANAMMTMWDVTNSKATHDDESLVDHISALVRNRDLWRELSHIPPVAPLTARTMAQS